MRLVIGGQVAATSTIGRQQIERAEGARVQLKIVVQVIRFHLELLVIIAIA